MELQRTRLEVAVTPQDALRALRGDERPFALIGDWAGGGAILGSEPVSVVEPRTLEAAQALLAARPSPFPTVTAEGVDHPGEHGVGGGWFGYLGYGLGGVFEELPPQPPRPAQLPLASLAWYDHVLHLDAEGAWWFEALANGESAERLEARRSELTSRLAGPPRAAPWQISDMVPSAPGYDGHLAAVADCVERIHAGEIFQANLCLRLEGALVGSALDAFADASAELRPSRAAFIGLDDAAVLSLSPELFLRRRGDRVESRPIKGTASRAEGEDGSALGGSKKDLAENLMIVDLMRNDLGRVARYGSVEAGRLPQLEQHPGLWHLVSHVGAALRDEIDDAALVEATFPPGSVTGAPKIQAMKVISSLEGTAREVYTGAIGYSSPVAGMELNVAIRTFELSGERLWLGAGGGVVADSTPAAELAEALAKARPLVAALGSTIEAPAAHAAVDLPAPVLTLASALTRPNPEAGLLETLAVRDGEPDDLDLHLARLAAGVLKIWSAELPRDLETRVRSAGAGHGLARLRIVARPGPGGLACEIDCSPVGNGSEPIGLRPLLLPGGLGAHKWADRALVDAASIDGAVALFVDADGAVLEAGHANVWLVEGDRLVTPPADGRLLPGVVRKRLLADTNPAGYTTAEEGFGLGRLERADAIVLSSSVSLARAAALEGASPAAGPAARLRAHLLGLVPSEVG